mmetsp:Transcript_6918/g.25486  ORF Transcript_6918/g.25486 Transcript_6918/m.25486 type:complete len:97 (+) Transcript_6918:629-919(+)
MRNSQQSVKQATAGTNPAGFATVGRARVPPPIVVPAISTTAESTLPSKIARKGFAGLGALELDAEYATNADLLRSFLVSLLCRATPWCIGILPGRS